MKRHASAAGAFSRKCEPFSSSCGKRTRLFTAAAATPVPTSIGYTSNSIRHAARSIGYASKFHRIRSKIHRIRNEFHRIRSKVQRMRKQNP